MVMDIWKEVANTARSYLGDSFYQFEDGYEEMTQDDKYTEAGGKSVYEASVLYHSTKLYRMVIRF